MSIPVEGPAQPPAKRHAAGEGHKWLVDDDRLVDVDDLGIVLRNVDDLRVGWLDTDDLFLDHDNLFVVLGEHPPRFGLRANLLDGIVDVLLLEVDGFP